MSLTARMHLVTLFTIILGGFACNEMPAPFEVEDRAPRADREAPFHPEEQYPGWAYDEPEYVKPAKELTPEPRVKKGDPLHYFTNKTIVPIRQPGNYTPEEVPQVAVWWTDNNGFHWHKAGYFGREQSFFPFEVEEDGDYGVRFVGPGQVAAMQSLPYPERVYHVDTALPEVEVTIDPQQTWYYPGQTVTISWRAEDYHLIENPVSLGLLMDFTADDRETIELQRGLSDEGTITYTIPENALDHEMRFRVDAEDRAGNLGIAFSYALQVIDETLVDANGNRIETTTDEQENATETETIEKAPTVTMTFPTQTEQTTPAQPEPQVAMTESIVPAQPDEVVSPARTETTESQSTQLVWNNKTPNTCATGGATEPQRSGSSLFNVSRSAPADASSVIEPMQPIDTPATVTHQAKNESVAHETASDFSNKNETTSEPQVMGLTGPVEPLTTPQAPAKTTFPSATKITDTRNIEPAPISDSTSEPMPMRDVTPMSAVTPASESPASFSEQTPIAQTNDIAITPVSDASESESAVSETDDEAQVAVATTETPEPAAPDAVELAGKGNVPEWEPAPVADADEVAEPIETPVSIVSTEWVKPEIATIIDPTHGNGLLIPMPATVSDPNPMETARLATAHPWRMLGSQYDQPITTVWVLPQPDFGYELEGLFSGEFLANSQIILPVAEPGQVDSAFAGVSADDIEVPSLTP